MLLYNITFGVDRAIEANWLIWVKANYITYMMGTGLFKEYKIYKILTHEDETTVSYSIQCFAQSIEDVLKYLNEYSPKMVEEHRQQFKDQHVAFNTLLQEV